MFSLIIGIVHIAGGILASACNYHRVYFVLGLNSLKVVQQSICGRSTKIYNIGELEKVDLYHNSFCSIDSNDNKRSFHYYELRVEKAKGQRDIISLI